MGACCSTFCRGEGDINKISSGATLDSKVNKFGGVDERALHLAQGRLIGNGASSKACLYTQQGKKGTNQDAMIVWEVRFASSHVCFGQLCILLAMDVCIIFFWIF